MVAKSKDGFHWNSRPAGPGRTEFHVGWVNYLDGDERWRPIDCGVEETEIGTFRVTEAPFLFEAPARADGAAYFLADCRYDIFARKVIDAPPLGQTIEALDAANVPGRLFDLNGDGRMDAVLYEGAFPQWGADLIYYVRHGRAPRLEKLVRFNGPIPADIEARFSIVHDGDVEVSPRRIRGARRDNHWDRRGKLHHDGGFYIRAAGEAQKRGAGIKTPRIWDSNPDMPRSAEVVATLEEDGNGLILTKHVPADFFTPETVYPVYTDTVTTFYPDADAETTSVDGLVRTDSSGRDWATTRAYTGAGIQVFPSLAAHNVAQEQGHATTNQFRYHHRTFFLFDTSSIGDTDDIDSAVLSIYGTGKDNALDDVNAVLVSSSPTSDTDLVAADYGLAAHFGTTEFAARIAYAAWDGAGYNDFTLNASGLAAISKTGVSKFGVLSHFDFDDTSPTWASGNVTSSLGCDFADTTGTANDPKLVVTHSAPSFQIQPALKYTVRATPAATTKSLHYSVQGPLSEKTAKYTVRTTKTPLTKGLQYAIAAGVITGTVRDRRGTAIDCSVYNVRINVYPKGNTVNAPLATQLVTAADGTWTVSDLQINTKYLVTFEFEGTYTPLGEADIAGAIFLTSYYP